MAEVKIAADQHVTLRVPRHEYAAARAEPRDGETPGQEELLQDGAQLRGVGRAGCQDLIQLIIRQL